LVDDFKWAWLGIVLKLIAQTVDELSERFAGQKSLTKGGCTIPPAASSEELEAIFIDRREDFWRFAGNTSTGCGGMGRLGTVFVGRLKVSP